MPSATTHDRPRRVAVRAAQLFDSTSATLRENPMVLIDGDTITAVDFGVAPPPDAEVHDLDGATLLPGLVDIHVHLAFDASPTAVDNLAARSEDEVIAAMTEAGRRAALGGVTTVRDLGDRAYLSLQLRGRTGLPTILAAGPPMTLANGHCHFLGGVVEQGEQGVRAGVRDRVERGVDVIKVMGSGGQMTPGTRQEEAQFSPAEMVAIVDEAHRHGRPVAVHAHATAGVANAVAAGVDTIEHVTFWTADGVESPADLIAEIARRQVVVSATAGMLPPAPEVPPPPPEIVARIPLVLANIRLLLDAGARVLAGSDAGIGPGKPHDVLRYAPPMMQATGLEPGRVLQIITALAADAIGVGASKGRLAAGYDADLLVVRGNPVDDVQALHDIEAVYVRGERVR